MTANTTAQKNKSFVGIKTNPETDLFQSTVDVDLVAIRFSNPPQRPNC